MMGRHFSSSELPLPMGDLQWAAFFPPQNCPFPWGIYNGPPLFILRIAASHGASTMGRPFSSSELPLPMGDLARPSPQPKQHLDRFGHLCTVDDRDRQTDRQTTLLGV